MITWNADADSKLLAAILKTMDGKLNHQAIADEMGNGCTAKAITHRIANIKKNVATAGGTNGTTSPAAPATPASSNKRVRKTNVKNEDGDGSPAKKPKIAKAKSSGLKKNMKMETGDSDGNDDNADPEVKDEGDDVDT